MIVPNLEPMDISFGEAVIVVTIITLVMGAIIRYW